MTLTPAEPRGVRLPDAQICTSAQDGRSGGTCGVAAPPQESLGCCLRDRRSGAWAFVWLGMVRAGHRGAVRHRSAADDLGRTEELKRGESEHPVGGAW